MKVNDGSFFYCAETCNKFKLNKLIDFLAMAKPWLYLFERFTMP